MKIAPRSFVKLARDQRGASVIETALILPILLTLFAGATDFAMGFMVKMRTQQAAARSIELATAGGLQSLSETTLAAEAATAADVPPGQVTVRKWLECDGAPGDFDVGCDTGTPARYVEVSINNSYSPMFAPLLPSGVAPDGKISFTGYSSLRLQ